jgi:hypothetical protein
MLLLLGVETYPFESDSAYSSKFITRSLNKAARVVRDETESRGYGDGKERHTTTRRFQ